MLAQRVLEGIDRHVRGARDHARADLLPGKLWVGHTHDGDVEHTRVRKEGLLSLVYIRCELINTN